MTIIEGGEVYDCFLCFKLIENEEETQECTMTIKPRGTSPAIQVSFVIDIRTEKEPDRIATFARSVIKGWQEAELEQRIGVAIDEIENCDQ